MNKLLLTVLLFLCFGSITKAQIENPTPFDPQSYYKTATSNSTFKILSSDIIRSGNFQHIVGADFGTNTNPSPFTWKNINSEGTYTTFFTETGGEANIELEITTAAGSYAYHYNALVNANTIPLHQNTLDEIEGNLYHFGNNVEIYFKFKGLEPFAEYDVWIFGVRDGSAGINQNVTLTGYNTNMSFAQIGGNSDLYINDQLGSSMDSLSNYSLTVPANVDGEILYTVTSGGELYAVAGIAIDIMTPTILTDSVSSLSTTDAIFNAQILDLGNPNATEHGFCWNTTGNPSLNDNISQEGIPNSIGVYSSTINNLEENTTYYIRSYATNNTGTEYGNEIVYTHTPPAIPLNNSAIIFTIISMLLFSVYRIQLTSK